MKTSWNYRVIEFVDPNGTPWRAIHEVYYENGWPTMYSEDPAPITASKDDGDMIESMKFTLRMMADALEKPALVERDFPKGSDRESTNG